MSPKTAAAIRDFDREVDEEASKMINKGALPYKAIAVAARIVSERRAAIAFNRALGRSKE